jgi:uncharacterized protein
METHYNSMMDKDAATWGMLCHISALAGFLIPFGQIIGPLVIWLLKRDISEFVNQCGKEALNFQISLMIYILVAGGLLVASMLTLNFIGIFAFIGLLIILGIINLVLSIVAGIKATNFEIYHYPLCFRFIS